MCDFQINGVLVTKLRVVDLKEELEARGLSKSGKKDELIARLVSYLEANPEEATSNSAETIAEATEDGNSRDEMMRKWQEEREQLLRENEERRQEEERKVKEEQERAAREEAEKERLLNEEKERKMKEEQDRLAKEKQQEEEKRRLSEEKEKERKRLEDEEKARKEKEETERLKAQEAAERLRKEKELEEQKQKQLKKEEEEKKKKQAEEEKRKAEEAKKVEEEKAEKKKANAAAAEVKETPAAGAMDASKDEESLILETAADDTLVMEIEQADLVSEEPSKEEKEDLISAEPGQVTSLRKLGGSRTDSKDQQRKRGWGQSRNDSVSAVSISSNSLKDIVPDIAPLMDSADPIADREEGETNSIESDPDVAGPKIPAAIKKEEPVKKKKRITLTDDDNETNFLLITNLTRPFTVNGLKEMLKRTGTIQDFWIDRIKSTCCVKFDTTDQASETRMALNGVAWPVGNPKSLKVVFTSEEEMKRYQEASSEGVGKVGGEVGERLTGVREWDRNKVGEETGERDAKRDREARKPEREVRIRERSSERKPPLVLEDLFKKTAASPAIYWRPLSEGDIQKRIELRNKKMTEDKIRREMEDTKETIQKSNRLISSGSPT